MAQKERLNMSDFTKELNIIDFLGIGIPGCTLVLLLMGDQVEALLWANFFGTTCSELTRAIILIILGYIVGMLIHEIGDVIEKALWRIIWLDPKAYAAYAVGLNDITKKLEKDGKKAPKRAGWIIKLYCKHNKSSSENKCEDKLQHVLEFLKIFLSFAIIVLLLYYFVLLFVMALDTASKTLDVDSIKSLNMVFSISNFKISLYLVIIIISLLLGVTLLKLCKHISDINHVRSQNPYIQTYVAGYGNSSKRILFDGFRVTMRNLLVVIVIINLFSIWKPISAYQQICGALASSNQSAERDSRIFVLCSVAVVLLMFIRYCHYSFLKYKYSYEDYLKKHMEKQEGNTPEDAKPQ